MGEKIDATDVFNAKRFDYEKDAAYFELPPDHPAFAKLAVILMVCNEISARADRAESDLSAWHAEFPVNDPVIARRMVEDRAKAEAAMDDRSRAERAEAERDRLLKVATLVYNMDLRPTRETREAWGRWDRALRELRETIRAVRDGEGGE